ncbi:MAG: hypothetical protein J2P37_10160 [Ktedonobacteraceae bacterium]|nr:hypothetical protein [Ktedonobacteraceae bacterium]
MSKRAFFIGILVCLVLVGAVWFASSRMSPAGAVSADDLTPVGTFDAISNDGLLNGWALSRAQPSQAITVHIYVDGEAGKGGQFLAAVPANQPRPDVNKALHVGGDHGFIWAIPPTIRGQHTFYVYAIVPGWKPGMVNPQLQQSPISANVQHWKPIGTLDTVTRDGIVAGWTLDADHPTQTLTVHIYVDGEAGKGGRFLAAVPAGLPRSDVNKVTGYAGNHGFSWYIPARYHQYAKGKHTFYAYAIDPDGGVNPLLNGSPKTLDTKYRKPYGHMDGVTKGGMLWGWALAPEYPTQMLVFHIYVDGPAGKGGKIIAMLRADQARTDVNQATGYSGNHGFRWQIPALYMEGNHQFYAYAIDPKWAPGVENPLLQGAPVSFLK